MKIPNVKMMHEFFLVLLYKYIYIYFSILLTNGLVNNNNILLKFIIILFSKHFKNVMFIIYLYDIYNVYYELLNLQLIIIKFLITTKCI